MAACGAMKPQDRGPRDRRCLLLVAGCSNMVDGRAVIAVPRPGSPIAMGACQADPSDESRVPSGAECGMLSVPVDYAKPDGDVARIAMIRFKATGEKIGSLVINPGGPGESGVEAAASHGLRAAAVGARAVRSRRLRPARCRELHAGGVVQLRRRQRPAARRPSGRLHAGGRRAHREGDQGVRPALCRQDGQGVPGQHRNRQRRQGSRRDPRRARRRQADLSGLLVRHPDRVGCTPRLTRTRCGR